jgi:GTP cyclohydrolase I
MRDRAAIKRDEESYQANLERAKEGAALGAELRAAYARNKSLSREDVKKLERMEKLARKIRSGAGGSDDDEQLKDPPQRLEEALVRLAEISDALRKNVEKTSRLVVSASVIERSNELIELIRLIRTLPQ